MTDTVRERILTRLVENFTLQSTAAPIGDPYTYAWDQVLRSPTKDWAYKRRRTLGVYDMHETKKTLAALKDCTLKVSLEAAIMLNGDEAPSETLNEIFGGIQRNLGADPTLNGLAVDVQETSNDLQIEDENKRWVRGIVMIDIRYRHALSDPRRVV